MESKDRVQSALLSNSFKFPPLKITINLSPSEIKKSGTHFDLAIALLIALESYDVDLDDIYIFGELGLDGRIKDSYSIFILTLYLAQNSKIKNFLIPYESINKISHIPNINIYAVKDFSEAYDFFVNKNRDKYYIENRDFNFEFITIDNQKYYFYDKYDEDFIDVKGQIIAKRAALIAASGNHNILFEGSAGCGKSMISKRVRYIMPPMSLNDILQRAKQEAFDSLNPSFIPSATFRSPHHSSTKASIFGGGSTKAKMGEVALANGGVLFFDELPHFSKTVLEALREPLEDFKILISRVNSKIEYDANFLFIGAMNPCPCGNLLSTKKECRCSDIEVKRYKNRLSEPFLDRIDLYVAMDESDIDAKPSQSSKEMFEMVKNAFIKQKSRNQKNLNGKLSDSEIKEFCTLNSDSEDILKMASDRFDLSFRAINRVLKVARTIADLSNSNQIEKAHLLEALSYRKR
jgi:magnesium chelatase family protein